MFFVFGFGKRTVKELDLTDKIRCSNCANIRAWRYKKITTWFTLFFIPVIPYKVVYVKECPICKTAYLVEKNEALNVEVEVKSSHDETGLTDVQRQYREEMASLKKRH